MKNISIIIFLVFLTALSGCSKEESGTGAQTEKEGKAQETATGSDKVNVVQTSPVEGIDFINTDNYANTRLEFYYYIPAGVIADRNRLYDILMCIPPLSGKGQAFVGPEFKKFADENSLVIIAPSFMWDENNWKTKTSYQYPSEWSGNALLAIMDKVREKHVLLLSKLHLYGFSAGAQFALRFTLWRPDLCSSCAAHGSGGTIIPDRYVDVKYLVSVGKEDRSRIPLSEEFVEKAKNLGIDATFRLYEGGHNLPPEQMSDSLNFFKGVLEVTYKQ